MKVFIPQVDLTVTEDILFDVFQELNIGEVIAATFCKRRNHQFAFVDIKVFPDAIDFEKMVNNKQITTSIQFESKKFWVMKPMYSNEEYFDKSIEKECPENVMSVFNSVFNE